MIVRVVNAARSGIEPTELQVISALRRVDGAGIAVSGARVTVSGNPSAEVDLLVILPNLALVLEVKGIRERAGGTLYCPVQGDWSLPGVVGDPVHSQQSGNPREQVERVMYGFKNLADDVTGIRLFVDGLVLVVGWPGLPLNRRQGPHRHAAGPRRAGLRPHPRTAARVDRTPRAPRRRLERRPCLGRAERVRLHRVRPRSRPARHVRRTDGRRIPWRRPCRRAGRRVAIIGCPRRRP
ncbi:nuclease-related domain-containing protein [Nocardia heshunensis]